MGQAFSRLLGSLVNLVEEGAKDLATKTLGFGEVVDEVVDDDDDSCLGMIISSAVRRRFTGVSEGGS